MWKEEGRKKEGRKQGRWREEGGVTEKEGLGSGEREGRKRRECKHETSVKEREKEFYVIKCLTISENNSHHLFI